MESDYIPFINIVQICAVIHTAVRLLSQRSLIRWGRGTNLSVFAAHTNTQTIEDGGDGEAVDFYTGSVSAERRSRTRSRYTF